MSSPATRSRNNRRSRTYAVPGRVHQPIPATVAGVALSVTRTTDGPITHAHGLIASWHDRPAARRVRRVLGDPTTRRGTHGRRARRCDDAPRAAAARAVRVGIHRPRWHERLDEAVRRIAPAH